MLGIIIGVGAVIALVSLGNGAQLQVEAQIASLGTNLLMIGPASMDVGRVSQGAASRDTIDLDDVDALVERGT